jgi:diacylglycerol kinase family enzyme
MSGIHSGSQLPAPLPLFVAINAGSGGDKARLPEIIRMQLQERGHTVRVFEIPPHAQVESACADLVAQAAAANGMVVAAGGDGTVNAIAKLCYEYGVILGIIPLGTFNYFARGLGIPVELEKALDVLGTGHVRPIAAGFVQEHLFLNNASFGLYPTIIRKREEATAKYGRKRIIGALSALYTLMRKQKIFTVTLKIDGAEERHRTNMVFVGNNTLQLENLGLEVGECTKKDRLAVVVMKPMKRIETAGLVWRGIVKSLKDAPKLEQVCADNFEVNTGQSHLEVVVDGEIIRCTTPLVFRIEAAAINVIVPVTDPEGA